MIINNKEFEYGDEEVTYLGKIETDNPDQQEGPNYFNIDYDDSGTSGTWSWLNPDGDDYVDFILLKGTSNWVLFPSYHATSGTWSTIWETAAANGDEITGYDSIGEVVPISISHLEVPNGENIPSLSHIPFYDSPSPTPVPGAVWLLGSGLVGVLWVRRKKLKKKGVVRS